MAEITMKTAAPIKLRLKFRSDTRKASFLKDEEQTYLLLEYFFLKKIS